ncbi:hypothetical protein CD178_00037 [Komagataeibacter saccharivorans]|uniref:Uncharacterized protein n=1 Tax=Komagataeibacter saccharivorans TaxID=265959 RepID=A0A347W7N4_9PROT|nr:lasso peptide biosynthesis protein [Komagataeibacter saccharivorans]AXY20877.1 hypothetical protein CD178_00037 [Komagataeibacter saccharivorans]
MGEAKRNSEKLNRFYASMTEEEKIIYSVTQKLIDKFIKPAGLHGACYRTSILLNRILAKEYGIASTVVLGWINDGDDIFISHAWLEINDKKIDLMAERPLVTENRRGPTIILDHVFKGTSNLTYSYHLNKTREALEKDEEMIAVDAYYRKSLAVKDVEHARILRAIKSEDAMDAFLDECANEGQDGFTYSQILKVLSK